MCGYYIAIQEHYLLKQLYKLTYVTNISKPGVVCLRF
jgi:hypothetical protein